MKRRADILRWAGPALALVLAGCASKRVGTPDNEPTLKALSGRTVEVAAVAPLRGSEEQVIAAYRQFLQAAPRAELAPQRSEALRRLGDLEMERADQAAARSDSASGVPDYRAAIARYQDYLKAHPDAPGNDRVLYQLARAHEQGGALEVALATLDTLVQRHPRTPFAEEAQFRRGELLFNLRDYKRAEAAYGLVLAGGAEVAGGASSDSPLADRALYMQGWSRFKQGRLEEALQSFFGVLDRKLAALNESDDDLAALSRGERELVEDSFRVTSLSLAQLQGAASIPAYINSPARQGNEFRIYQQLAALYQRQDRPKDAADTLGAFAAAHPLHARAPLLQAQVIDIHARSGFANLALQAKKDHVLRYGVNSEFRRANPAGWQQAQGLVKTHLQELARHHHALAQSSKASADAAEAVRWYRELLQSFPTDAQAAPNHFLLAELLFDSRRWPEAATEYERVAYGYGAHAQAADAGYAALLAHAQRLQAAAATERPALQREEVASALRFGQAFGRDARCGPVLAHAAETLFALGDARAAEVATQVLALQPAAPAAQRRVAHAVLAHGARDAGRFDVAETHYSQALALLGPQEAGRDALAEGLATAVYRQGEAARSGGRPQEAVAHFERIAALAPASSVRATAQYDAAAAHIALQHWPAAIKLLEDFRQRFVQHPLQAEVPAKLAAAYLGAGQWASAAREFETLAARQTDANAARAAWWQAAELHQQAHDQAPTPAAAANTVRAYQRYAQQYPQPLLNALQSRWQLARFARAEGQGARELVWLGELLQAEQAGGAERSDATRLLGAQAALSLAEPAAQACRQVPLVEPLAKSLALKKARLEQALKAYAVVADYQVASTSTAASFHSAALYQDFGRALLASQRPKKLKKAELEQYNVMLEEQAYPFEERAIELHEANARRAAQGAFDDWVGRSMAALAQLRPARWAKAERGASAQALAALEAQARSPAPTPEAWNQLGVAQRQAGRLAQAQQAYEQALALNPALADAQVNLGILQDLYLGNASAAQQHFERALALVPGDAQLPKWLQELKNRKPARTVAAGKEGT